MNKSWKLILKINIKIDPEWSFPLSVHILFIYCSVLNNDYGDAISSLFMYCMKQFRENKSMQLKSYTTPPRIREQASKEVYVIPQAWVCVLSWPNHDNVFKPTAADNLLSSLVISWLIATL